MAKSTEKKKLWRAFAEFIRLRDAPDGYGACISCGKLILYPNDDGKWHAGHFLPRSITYNAVYFHEKNVNGQCRHCNTFLEGNTDAYREGLIKRYGEKVLEELDLARAINRKWYEWEYKELAKEYRRKVRVMKKERGL